MLAFGLYLNHLQARESKYAINPFNIYKAKAGRGRGAA